MRCLAGLVLLSAAPAGAQPAMHDMPGMAMPAAPPRKPATKAHRAPAPRPTPAAPMAAMPAMTMDHGGHEPPAALPPPATPTETAVVPGHAPPPPAPADHYADRTFPPAAMAAARARMMREAGGSRFHQILFNLAEIQAKRGRNGYRWDGEGWFGGDLDRLVVKSEGEGLFRRGVEAAELQALYSRAIGPYYDLQAGLRQDLAGGTRRTFLTAGVEGLAPYWFQTEARLFVATTGQVRGRLEAWVDQRLTQRLVLQPCAELNLAAQDDPRAGIGAGLSGAELGLRLRYELSREFAPYLGVDWEARAGHTADYARAAGERPRVTSLVGGVRFWF